LSLHIEPVDNYISGYILIKASCGS